MTNRRDQGIVIVDYGMGNLRSVQKAFEATGVYATLSSSRKEIKRAEKIVLPGVGAFESAVRELEKLKLMDLLRNKILSGTPYLGLCLGLQLLFDTSEESKGAKKVMGLGIIKGWVRRFQGKMKIPHMGWNTVRIKKKKCPLFKGVRDESYFYFVHSYFGVPDDNAWTASTTHYGSEFCSSIWRANIFATQFHPEKSQGLGLRLIHNFTALTTCDKDPR